MNGIPNVIKEIVKTCMGNNNITDVLKHLLDFKVNHFLCTCSNVFDFSTQK